jgi:integration host factor subunit alpha
MTLTKAHIVKALSKQNGYTKKQSVYRIEVLIEFIKRSLESGEDVAINGFGKFCVKEKHERLGRNPATGENMMLKPRRVVTFKRFQQLKDKTNGKQH